jgi:hypothetical protein
VGLLLSAMAISLLAVRASHAGALWRDECAVVQLAGMQSISAVLRNFQHEAFPPLFPLIVRIYAIVFGSSDAVLRIAFICAGAAALDLIASSLCTVDWLRLFHLRLGSAALIAGPFADWSAIVERQTRASRRYSCGSQRFDRGRSPAVRDFLSALLPRPSALDHNSQYQ